MFTITTAVAAAPGISDGQIMGPVYAGGAAAIAWTGLILGVRGSDWALVAMPNKKRAAWWGIATGTLSMAAGGQIASFVKGMGTVPIGILGEGSIFGNPGLGAVAAVLTMIAFGGKWTKPFVPAVLGIMAGYVYGQAGGLWGILVNVINTTIGNFT